ncbi:hypothetical protein [Roseateles sp.]|uniref:hypothetical protein n=1 Tax=Roseateles sp. TaxID=1971397 RepID=UPI00286AC9B4|nr:hypothetical protein [Roseateles sp.]
MRILYLTGRENPFYNELRNDVEGVYATEFFASDSLLSKLARRVVLNTPGASVASFFNKWIHSIDQFDVIVIYGTIYSNRIADALISRGYRDRLIHWFWNPVSPADRIELLKAQGVPIYTFDPTDATRFNLRLETTYYFSSLSLDFEGATPAFDIYFVGGDKGRLTQLLRSKQEFTDLGLTSTFHITDTGHRQVGEDYQFSKFIPYTEVIGNIQKARCLLDYVQEGQTGLTQRPMEALFHRKKLITNDRAIASQDFYRQENIFILGQDDPTGLTAFVRTEFQTVSPDIVARYDFANWLRRLVDSAQSSAVSSAPAR